MPDAHAGLEACRIGADDIAPADAAKLDQRQQRREHRPAGVKHDAAHVGVVIVEHVAHLAVGERRLHQAELALAAQHRRLRLTADRGEHSEELVDGRVSAAGQRATEPVDQPAARLVHGALRKVLETKARQEVGKLLRRVEARRGKIVVSLGGDLRHHSLLTACRGRR